MYRATQEAALPPPPLSAVHAATDVTMAAAASKPADRLVQLMCVPLGRCSGEEAYLLFPE
ncbi:hypothetical protein OM788_002315 [Streptomyces sp. KA12]|uniref:hypothetical protein n=1 Tax=Streptomyces sp. KA12 TaxID=2991730 RepID=UPI0023AFC67A|nr:hypothetical protein [Streptomyces sp. KA12]MDF0372458.1 hypothetical protein [Streptomyces sp. KA12]